MASVEPMLTNVALPAFFVVVGSSVAITELDRPERWLALAVGLVVAVVAKPGGSAGAVLVTTFAAGPLLRRRSASSGSGRSGFGPVRVP